MKCSKCGKYVQGLQGHICAGSTVAGTSMGTWAIKDCIDSATDVQKQPGDIKQEAREQLDALVERIATLEQQLETYHKECETIAEWKRIYREKIEYAKRHGYELARNYALEKSDGYTQIKPYDELSEYERDGGAV